MVCRPHYSGTTLDAQARYAAGTKEILRRTFDNEPLNETDVIVQARSCSLWLSLMHLILQPTRVTGVFL